MLSIQQQQQQQQQQQRIVAAATAAAVAALQQQHHALSPSSSSSTSSASSSSAVPSSSSMAGDAVLASATAAAAAAAAVASGSAQHQHQQNQATSSSNAAPATATATAANLNLFNLMNMDEDDPLFTDFVLSNYYGFGDLDDLSALTAHQQQQQQQQPQPQLGLFNAANANSIHLNSQFGVLGGLGALAGLPTSANPMLNAAAGLDVATVLKQQQHFQQLQQLQLQQQQLQHMHHQVSRASSVSLDAMSASVDGSSTSGMLTSPGSPQSLHSHLSPAPSSASVHDDHHIAAIYNNAAAAAAGPSASASASAAVAAAASFAASPAGSAEQEAFVNAATAAARASANGLDPNAAAAAAYTATMAAHSSNNQQQQQQQQQQRAVASAQQAKSPNPSEGVSSPPSMTAAAAFGGLAHSIPAMTAAAATSPKAASPLFSFGVLPTPTATGASAATVTGSAAAAAASSSSSKMAISRLPAAAAQTTKAVPKGAASGATTTPLMPSKTEKKSAHNVIERRYRNSINDRILELRDVVPVCREAAAMVAAGTNTVKIKLNKATILRKAIEYIVFLQGSLERSRHEKATMQHALEMHGVDATQLLQTIEAELGAIKTEMAFSAADFDDNEELDEEFRDLPSLSNLLESEDSNEDVSPSDSPTITAMTEAVKPAKRGRKPKAAAVAVGDGSTPDGRRKKAALVIAPASSGGLLGGSTVGAMRDGSRMMLFVLMLVTLFVSPIDTLVDTNAPAEHLAVAARTLSSVEVAQLSNTIWMQGLLMTAAWWFLRAVVVVVCLARVFFGEPVTSSKSLEYHRAQELQKAALANLANGDRAYAETNLIAALEILGRPQPTSTPELYVAVAWQIIRQVLHRLWIGQWIDEFVASRNSNARVSFKAAAGCFHMLQMVQFMSSTSNSGHSTGVSSSTTASDSDEQSSGNVSAKAPVSFRSSLHRLNVVLNAVNLAEASRGSVSPSFLIEVYSTAALQLKYAFPRRFHFVTRQLLMLAKSVRADAGDLDPSLGWLFHTDGYAFISRGLWRASFARQAALSRTLSPLGLLGSMYRTALLDRAFAVLVEQGNALRALDLMQEARQYALDAADVSAEWWAYIGLSSAHLRLGHTTEAIRAFQTAEHLLSSGTMNEPVTQVQQALDQALRGSIALLMDDGVTAIRCTEMASALLRDDPALVVIRHRAAAASAFQQQQQQDSDGSSAQGISDTDSGSEDDTVSDLGQRRRSNGLALSTGSAPLQQLAASSSILPHSLTGQILACVHLMDNRFALWQWLRASHLHPARVQELPLTTTAQRLSAGVNGDVDVLRCLSHAYPAAHSLAFLYQAMARTLAGGSSQRTRAMFVRALAEARSATSPFAEACVLLKMGQLLVDTESQTNDAAAAGGAADRSDVPTVDERRHWLSAASHIFESLHATQELDLCRSLLKALLDSDK
ncbi:hypothetical protein CAOG_005901 [Capsaspora owczarzaki ATCC 30864]|uniref:BHLH domain-containing protein n=2 Tax=Capsaspora owczarzaki (strain ATCC 30864) TaxID=595528 RepID=A0A0D2VVE9_CAPO3|nr:hypothetical protein CAOG_005901 [Capsaspora owczarzaki ATCC 30864]